jgi:hypothetical protein
MNKQLLEAVRHELTTLHGLEVCDGAAPDSRFRLDESALLARIDAALSPPLFWCEVCECSWSNADGMPKDCPECGREGVVAG